jgi:hypothetical protein
VTANRKASNRSRGQLTDREIYTLIRYLDPEQEERKKEPGPKNAGEHDDTAAFALCVIFAILLLVCLASVWLR